MRPDRVARCAGAFLILVCAVLVGVVGWFAKHSVGVSVFLAAMVLVEGGCVVLGGELISARRARRRHRRWEPAHRTVDPADPNWVPEGWFLPAPEQRNTKDPSS
jgi:membrane protein YdbS with pleckstrin-like domain